MTKHHEGDLIIRTLADAKKAADVESVGGSLVFRLIPSLSIGREGKLTINARVTSHTVTAVSKRRRK